MAVKGIRATVEAGRSAAECAENMPRPGIEPGLEVPETSVMSFSLPGREDLNPES